MEKDPPSELAQLITKLSAYIHPSRLYTRAHVPATGSYHVLDESVSPSHIPLFLSVSVRPSNRLVSRDYSLFSDLPTKKSHTFLFSRRAKRSFQSEFLYLISFMKDGK
jgi:hypothetical protein